MYVYVHVWVSIFPSTRLKNWKRFIILFFFFRCLRLGELRISGWSGFIWFIWYLGCYRILSRTIRIWSTSFSSWYSTSCLSSTISGETYICRLFLFFFFILIFLLRCSSACVSYKSLYISNLTLVYRKRILTF